MLRLLTAGESHGPSLVAILEGLPAGLPVDIEGINHELARRQRGFGSGGRMKIEQDTAVITGGVLGGHTTGAPVAVEIKNKDWINWQNKEIAPMTVPRPGHADLNAAIKYQYKELRLALERASARETAARVAAGSLCRQFLDQFGIKIGSYVVQIGPVCALIPEDMPYEERFALAEESDVRCPDLKASDAMRDAISGASRDRDTLGGVFEVAVLDLPPGLGSHVQWDRRLSGQLMSAIGSIQAVKGVEIGPAFINAGRRGTQVHDEIQLCNGRLERRTNRAGGLEGGITTGEPLVIRAAMKPISTTLTPIHSVDLATGKPAETRYERSDICGVTRAAVVGEAMAAFVLAGSLQEKLGGDSISEMLPRFSALSRGEISAWEMDNVPWHF